jgi:bifunctional non-homologous end joining protein LigD
MTRYPNGIDAESFYEKDIPRGTPPWVKTSTKYSEVAKRNINYVLCNDLDTLIWLANLAALELHITLAKASAFDNPDILFFDLDPQPPASFDQVVSVSLLLKETLEELGLKSYVKTSGKRGLHIALPIKGQYSFEQTRGFVHTVAQYLSKKSDIVDSQFRRKKVPGTIYVDYRQNSHGRTMVSPYSLRATPQGTVSAPIEWGEVKKELKPEMLTLLTVGKSERRPWEGFLLNRQKLDVS